jgi:hypothetical protein
MDLNPNFLMEKAGVSIPHIGFYNGNLSFLLKKLRLLLLCVNKI